MNNDEFSELQRDFLIFRRECVWLQTCFNTYAALYESGCDTQRLLWQVARSFFHDLNLILIEYIILQVCRLTDPANNGDNLTVEHINASLEKCGLLTDQMLAAAEKMRRYRLIVKKSRNKIISHADKRSLLNDDSLSGHEREEIDFFFVGLYLYIDEVGKALDVGPLDFRCTAVAGDVLDLIRTLKVQRSI